MPFIDCLQAASELACIIPLPSHTLRTPSSLFLLSHLPTEPASSPPQMVPHYYPATANLSLPRAAQSYKPQCHTQNLLRTAPSLDHRGTTRDPLQVSVRARVVVGE